MKERATKTNTITTDIIVVGAGAAGLSAAATAAEAGAKVAVFEKMDTPGGTANGAEGVFAVESKHQKRKNISVTKDETFRNIMEYSHWRANPRLVRAFVEKSADTLDWLERHGVEFEDVRTTALGGMMTWHIFKGRGASAIKALAKAVEESKNMIYLSTPVERLLVDDKGRVAGIEAITSKDERIWAHSRAVVIATGGYANNREMLEKYTVCGPSFVTILNTGKMGDGIRMAWAVGAAEEGIGVAQLRGPVVPGEKPDSALNITAKQPYLWVNLRGERFCDESINSNFPYAGNALARQPGQMLYLILDTDTKRYLMEKGIDLSVGDYTLAGTKLATLDAELERGMRNALVLAGHSLTELAEKIGLNPKNLKATIDEYNLMCDHRQDTLFGKDKRYMHPVRQPNFYAMKLVPSLMGTLGGIKINHRTEVLDKLDEVIPGLYAAGNDAGGMYGDSYDLLVSPGSTWGFAANSGRIAAENALNYLAAMRGMKP
jgi:fumarate reductase flavoprotein subunit